MIIHLALIYVSNTLLGL